MGERKIFIAIDGSKPSDEAFTWCLANIHRPGDMICLVHSAEYKVDLGLPGIAADLDSLGKAVKEEDDRINNLTTKYIEILKKRTIPAKSLTLKGSKPGEGIIKAAVEEKANVIVLGSRGLGKIRRTLLGSVSEYVTQHAPPHCAVIILRDS